MEVFYRPILDGIVVIHMDKFGMEVYGPQVRQQTIIQVEQQMIVDTNVKQVIIQKILEQLVYLIQEHVL